MLLRQRARPSATAAAPGRAPKRRRSGGPLPARRRPPPSPTSSSTAAIAAVPPRGGRGDGGVLDGGLPEEQAAAAAAAAPADPGLSAAELAAAELAPGGEVWPLHETRALVETAMLAAVTGLAYLLSTLLKLEGSLGYVIPLPVVLAAVRSGGLAGWRTCAATAALVVVLLGPLRAVAYCLYHGLLAAALGGAWRSGLPWAATVPLGALVRVGGQLAYIALSSATLNENLFAVLLANVHALLDQLSAAVGASGAPSPSAVASMIFALLLVNGCCYVFLLHVLYTLILGGMGYAERLPAVPGLVRKFLTAGAPERPSAAAGTAAAAGR
jgi:hypothetical protein